LADRRPVLPVVDLVEQVAGVEDLLAVGGLDLAGDLAPLAEVDLLEEPAGAGPDLDHLGGFEVAVVLPVALDGVLDRPGDGDVGRRRGGLLRGLAAATAGDRGRGGEQGGERDNATGADRHGVGPREGVVRGWWAVRGPR